MRHTFDVRWILYAFAIVFLLAVANAYTLDFMAFYYAGDTVLRGTSHLLYDIDATRMQQTAWGADNATAYLYPPAFAALYAPFAALPPKIAYLTWSVLSIALAGIAVHAMQQWNMLLTRMLRIFVFYLPTTILGIGIGQNTLLTLALFALVAGYYWRDHRGTMPGILAGALLYKPQLLIPILVVWLWHRRAREIAGFAASASCVAIGSLLVSVPASVAFVRDVPAVVLTVQDDLMARGTLASVPALTGWPVALAIGAVTIALLLATDRESRYHHALLWLAPLVVTPHLGGYDLTLVVLPISFVLYRWRTDRLLLGALCAIAVGQVAIVAGYGLAPATLSLLALWCVVVWHLVPHVQLAIFDNRGVELESA